MDIRNTFFIYNLSPNENRSETCKQTKVFVLTNLIEDQLVSRGAQKYVDVVV